MGELEIRVTCRYFYAKRMKVDLEKTFGAFAEKLAKDVDYPDPTAITFKHERKELHIDATPASAKLSRGDIIEAIIPENPSKGLTETLIASQRGVSSKNPSTNPRILTQDAVDDFLDSQSGSIHRPKDPKLCLHGNNGMCTYCMPLEPFDQGYLDENKIKHMSFHAYLRKLGAKRQKNVLEEPNFKVKVPCRGVHARWPAGICTMCQPSAITLQRQTYRLVDHVEFSTPSLVDNFIHFWRGSGHQRFGYLYGRYEPYLEVPLGIKAVVEAIYEPPQENHSDGLALDSWEEEDKVTEVAAACGLVRVGMIFTDLTDDGTGRGTVVPKRHIDSYFLSSLECSFVAEMQHRHPNITKYSTSGKFGSKFVTCVVSGNLEGAIDVTAYQVSDTMMALQEAAIVEPSWKPSVLRVKESVAGKLYVPEVIYNFRNEYGYDVPQTAKPTFPVEYLLVNVTHGFPQTPSPLFKTANGYPVENRTAVLEQQSLAALGKHLARATTPAEKKQLLADFHLLCFIRSTGTIDNEADLKKMCEIATQDDKTVEELDTMDSWKTLEMIAGEAGNTPATQSTSATPSNNEPQEITCRHCTFTNLAPGGDCGMCGLPLNE